ncbi:Talin-1 [Lobulomyces angularis]|nr:Talin-1 [Lobulomyces angularis]
MASSALLKSATSVQREIVSKGKANKGEKMYYNDGTWSDGLVSSAKQVATATQSLCDSANQSLKGTMNRDRVIVAAKAVSASTAQLLSAAIVRSDPNSQSQSRLKAAGKAVISATTQLVKASEESMAFSETDTISFNMEEQYSNPTTAKVMEMEAQMSILKMEKELERARNKLASVRKGKYDINTAKTL